MRAEAVEAMMPYLSELYANPSGSHRFARRARQAIDESRDTVAAIVGCRPNEVVFTGCGTESDNTAIAGAVSRLGGSQWGLPTEAISVTRPGLPSEIV